MCVWGESYLGEKWNFVGIFRGVVHHLFYFILFYFILLESGPLPVGAPTPTPSATDLGYLCMGTLSE